MRFTVGSSARNFLIMGMSNELCTTSDDIHDISMGFDGFANGEMIAPIVLV
jgi:hypothetical protein